MEPNDLMGTAVRLGGSVDALAALAAFVRLETEQIPADPAVRDLLEQITTELVGGDGMAEPAVAAPIIGLARTFLRQAAEMIENPGRSGNWDQVDVPLLQSMGRLSMAISGAFISAGRHLPDLGALLNSPGARLLDGSNRRPVNRTAQSPSTSVRFRYSRRSVCVVARYASFFGSAGSCVSAVTSANSSGSSSIHVCGAFGGLTTVTAAGVIPAVPRCRSTSASISARCGNCGSMTTVTRSSGVSARRNPCPSNGFSRASWTSCRGEAAGAVNSARWSVSARSAGTVSRHGSEPTRNSVVSAIGGIIRAVCAAVCPRRMQ